MSRTASKGLYHAVLEHAQKSLAYYMPKRITCAQAISDMSKSV